MNYSTIKYFSTANGSGVRTAVFVSGCEFRCPGCFNPESWDFKYGKELTEEVIDKILDSIEPEYISGLSVLGGEPLNPKNIEGVHHLIDRFRERFGWNKEKDVWLWTGYTVESFDNRQSEILPKIDYLVDGPFIAAKKDLTLPYRGSSNQRIMHIHHVNR